jgi:uncharacterized membrane protein
MAVLSVGVLPREFLLGHSEFGCVFYECLVRMLLVLRYLSNFKVFGTHRVFVAFALFNFGLSYRQTPYIAPLTQRS